MTQWLVLFVAFSFSIHAARAQDPHCSPKSALDAFKPALKHQLGKEVAIARLKLAVPLELKTSRRQILIAERIGVVPDDISIDRLNRFVTIDLNGLKKNITLDPKKTGPINFVKSTDAKGKVTYFLSGCQFLTKVTSTSRLADGSLTTLPES